MQPARPAATALEALLRRERWLTVLSLGLVVAACWAWIVPAALDMYGDMDGLSAWMMEARWTLAYGLAIFAMWLAMMAGMMLPSAAPTLLLYGVVCRSAGDGGEAASRVHAFAGGYLVAWGGFSAAATLLQWQLVEAGQLTPMMTLASAWTTGLFALIAGVYQWAPLKQRCLAQCRSPAAFISSHWRAGTAGALRMGMEHGLYCLGCCWALMLLLFAGGVMSLAWIAGLTVWVLAEKLLPAGLWLGRAAGLVLIAWGSWKIAG
jgi:predicted metal-binding membrane protein